MANLKENAAWESGIYQLETTDPVVGGADGISNKQAIQLANRTSYLKGEVETLKSDASAKLASKRDVSDSYSKAQTDEKFALKNQMLGINQTTKVVTAERAFNTFYENTTEKPIMLYIDAWNNNTILQITLNVTIGNATLTSSNTATTTAATHTNITAPIPPKTRYIVTSNGALYSWVELS